MLRRKGALMHTPCLLQNNKQNDTTHIKQHAEMQNNNNNNKKEKAMAAIWGNVHRIKALQQLSEMKDCSSGAFSDERSRPRGWADLAPQSHTRGVTFLARGWLTRLQLPFSFPLYCEGWWPKFPSTCCESRSLGLRDKPPLVSQGPFLCGNVAFSTRIKVTVR